MKKYVSKHCRLVRLLFMLLLFGVLVVHVAGGSNATNTQLSDTVYRVPLWVFLGSEDAEESLPRWLDTEPLMLQRYRLRGTRDESGEVDAAFDEWMSNDRDRARLAERYYDFATDLELLFRNPEHITSVRMFLLTTDESEGGQIAGIYYESGWGDYALVFGTGAVVEEEEEEEEACYLMTGEQLWRFCNQRNKAWLKAVEDYAVSIGKAEYDENGRFMGYHDTAPSPTAEQLGFSLVDAEALEAYRCITPITISASPEQAEGFVTASLLALTVSLILVVLYSHKKLA